MSKLLLRLLLLALALLTAQTIVTAEEDNEESDTDSDGEEEGSIPEENDVLVLTTENFDQAIASREFILIEFYAPWCGHCKQLAPEFEKAAKKLKLATPPVALAKVDATIEQSLATRFDVTGYPTLKWFKNGEPFEYEGPREEIGIIDFMREKTDPTWRPPPEAVVTLTAENFSEVTTNGDLTIVMFYAPWCGHCKKMKPDYEKAAQELIKSGKQVVLAKVDATQETELAKQYEVSGYPTLKIFRKGRVSEYKSDARDKWGMMSFIEKQIGEASKLLASSEELKQYISDTSAATHVVAFFNNMDDPTYATYTQLSDIHRDDYEFAHSFDLAEVGKLYHLHAPALVMFTIDRFHTPYAPHWQTLPLAEDTRPSVLKSFLTKHSVPMLGEFDSRTKEKLYKDTRPLVLFFYTVDWSFEHKKATQQWRQKFAAVAEKFKDSQLTFAIADEERNSDLFKEFGFDESAEELNVGVLGPGDKKFALSPAMEEYDASDVTEFIQKFLKGKLKAKVRSQPVPKKQKGAVTVVVGETFDKVVLDEKKDVLIELYAPWCGHCKSLEPIYAQLAKKLKKEKNLVIAKMDATANDAPEGFSAGGYPTIYLSPVGSKAKPIKFEGDRNVEAMEKFLRENAVASFGKKKGKKDEL